MIRYQLLRPISYLTIKDQTKWKIDWLVPIFIAVVFIILFYNLPVKKPLYGDQGLIKELQGILQILPGFYLAALAAVATFSKDDLDRLLPEPTPKINILVKGQEVLIGLTRRRMLCFLFGYLTFLSLIVYLSTVLGSTISPSALAIFRNYSIIIEIIFVSLFSLFFWQMIIVTLFGLYQLCDRIHYSEIM